MEILFRKKHQIYKKMEKKLNKISLIMVIEHMIDIQVLVNKHLEINILVVLAKEIKLQMIVKIMKVKQYKKKKIMRRLNKMTKMTKKSQKRKNQLKKVTKVKRKNYQKMISLS